MEVSLLFVSELGSLFCYENENSIVAFLVWGIDENGFIDWLDK